MINSDVRNEIATIGKTSTILQEYSDLSEMVLRLQDEVKQLLSRPLPRDSSQAIESLSKVTESLKTKLVQVEQKVSMRITDQTLGVK